MDELYEDGGAPHTVDDWIAEAGMSVDAGEFGRARAEALIAIAKMMRERKR